MHYYYYYYYDYILIVLCHHSRLAILIDNCLESQRRLCICHKIQSQSLGDFQSAVHAILDVSVLGVLGLPPPVPLETPVWYLSICCSGCTTCP